MKVWQLALQKAYLHRLKQKAQGQLEYQNEVSAESLAKAVKNLGNKIRANFNGLTVWTRIRYEKYGCRGVFGSLGWKTYTTAWKEYKKGGIDGKGLFDDLRSAYKAAKVAGEDHAEEFKLKRGI